LVGKKSSGESTALNQQKRRRKKVATSISRLTTTSMSQPSNDEVASVGWRYRKLKATSGSSSRKQMGSTSAVDETRCGACGLL